MNVQKQVTVAIAGLFHFTPASANAKTGPIPVTTSPRPTCPDACIFKGAGCYAENAPLSFHWNNISKGKYGITYDAMCASIASLTDGHCGVMIRPAI